MKWTTQLPTKPGWYWHHIGKTTSPRMVLVEKQDDGLYMIRPWQLTHWKLESLGAIGEWAGPIPEPVEPEEKA